MKKLKFGICQGRLTIPKNNQLQYFPQGKWEEEIKIAKSLGYDYIELLSERQHNNENPLWSNSNPSYLKEAIYKYNLNSYSACLDYIIEHKIIDKNKINQNNLDYTINFIKKAANVGTKLIVLPLLEASNIDKDNITTFIDYLNKTTDCAQQYNIMVTIESLENSDVLIELVDSVKNENIGVVYDTGNRALTCDKPLDEIKKLNSRIKHIHLKDIRKNIGNVPIGTGVVDFKNIFILLNDIKYNGCFSFENHRGKDPIETAIHNINFIKYVY